MEYRQIVAVTGLSGLYQLMSTKNDGAIVRSLVDKSVKFVSARVHQITPLESIEIYTTDDNVRLHDVLENLKEQKEGIANLNISKSSNSDLRGIFRKALANFDEERVYVSDIKKILRWFLLLDSNDLLKFEYLKATEEEAAVEDIEVNEEDNTKNVAAKKKKNSTEEETIKEEEKAPKKAAAKKKKATESTDEEPKAAKKTAAKKKKED